MVPLRCGVFVEMAGVRVIWKEGIDMKRTKRFLSLLMVAALGMFALAGCGSDDTASDTAGASAASESSADSENNSDLLIGEVNQVTEDELALEIYESEKAADTAEDVDPEKLSATGKHETIALDDDVVVEYLEDGVTQTTSASAIDVGDMLVITEDEGQHIYIIRSANFVSTDEGSASGAATVPDESSTTDTEEEDSTSENTGSVPPDNGSTTGEGGGTASEGNGGTSTGGSGSTGGSVSDPGTGVTDPGNGGNGTTSGGENTGIVE